MGARATLAGIPVAANQPHEWTLTAGTKPQQRRIEVSLDAATAIMACRGEPVEYAFEAPGHPAVRVRDLRIVALLAGSTPYSRSILVADKRWFWSRVHIVRDYNLRRRSGEARLVGEGNFRVENAVQAADVAYAAWSLVNNATRWTAAEMVADVFRALGGASVPAISRGVEVEDLTLNDAGDVAAQKALEYVAGYNVTVDLDGTVRVFDSRDASEASMVAAAGPPGVSPGGYRAMADRANARPRGVEILFEREVELRFDYVEGESPSSTARDGAEERRLENVLPLPDVSLSVAGRTLYRGTWVGIDDYLSALSGLQPAHANGPLTHAVIRQYYLQMWHLLSDRYGRDVSGNPDIVWLRRIAAIRQHWRKTFRVLPPWRDRIRSMRAYRIGTIDTETGTRAPSEAFMDYLSKPSFAGLAKTVTQNTDIGHQVAGYQALLSSSKAAPARVTVLDEEAGILRVDLTRDPFGEADELAPGNVPRLPTREAGQTRGQALVTWATATLNEAFGLAVVLTCVQAAPNTSGRLHAEQVTPEEAEKVLGRPIGKCDGPTWTVAIGGNLQPARFAWSDVHAPQIDQAFYRGDISFPDTLVNREAIRALAEAEAARIYGTLLDRVDGSFSVRINPDVRVTGALSMVTHGIATSGEVTTTLMLAAEREPLNAMAFVPTSVQRAVRKLVQA